MTQGYCMKCKKNIEMIKEKKSKTSKGTKMVRGKCPICNTDVCRITGNK